MARSNNGLPNYELISIWFNDKEKTEYQEWIDGNTSDSGDLVLQLLENKLKISYSLQQDDETILVSLTMKPAQKNAKGMVFMYRHTDLDKCLRIAYFHMAIVMDFKAAPIPSKTDTAW